MTGRTRILAIIAGALVLLVAADQLLFKGGGDAEAGDEPTAAERYRQAAQRLATKRAMIERTSDYERLLADAEGKWAEARERMMTAGTAQLAAALLGNRVRDLADEYRPLGYAARRSDARPIEGAPGVYELELAVSMDLASSRDAFELIDRLENMPELAANVVSVRLNGPGQLGRRGASPLSLSLTLQSLAVVEEEG